MPCSSGRTIVVEDYIKGDESKFCCLYLKYVTCTNSLNLFSQYFTLMNCTAALLRIHTVYGTKYTEWYTFTNDIKTGESQTMISITDQGQIHVPS